MLWASKVNEGSSRVDCSAGLTPADARTSWPRVRARPRWPGQVQCGELGHGARLPWTGQGEPCWAGRPHRSCSRLVRLEQAAAGDDLGHGASRVGWLPPNQPYLQGNPASCPRPAQTHGPVSRVSRADRINIGQATAEGRPSRCTLNSDAGRTHTLHPLDDIRIYPFLPVRGNNACACTENVASVCCSMCAAD